MIVTNITTNSDPARGPLSTIENELLLSYLRLFRLFGIISMMSPLTKMKRISQAQKYRNNRYFLPVSILFFKTLVSIVSSIWYRYRPIPTRHKERLRGKLRICWLAMKTTYWQWIILFAIASYCFVCIQANSRSVFCLYKFYAIGSWSTCSLLLLSRLHCICTPKFKKCLLPSIRQICQNSRSAFCLVSSKFEKCLCLYKFNLCYWFLIDWFFYPDYTAFSPQKYIFASLLDLNRAF
jgi:hypothetical protein